MQCRYLYPVHLFSLISHTEAVRLFHLIEFPLYYKKQNICKTGSFCYLQHVLWLFAVKYFDTYQQRLGQTISCKNVWGVWNSQTAYKGSRGVIVTSQKDHSPWIFVEKTMRKWLELCGFLIFPHLLKHNLLIVVDLLFPKTYLSCGPCPISVFDKFCTCVLKSRCLTI